MIVKNEEKNVSQCLNSVKDFVEEMIILDTGSTDSTVEIAKQLGAKVYNYQWQNDFAAARNEALKYVNGEWVLILDGDEELIPEIIPEIKELISNENNLVINLLREEVGSNAAPFSLISRLFRNHSQLKFSRPYHELIDDSVTELLTKENHWKIVSLPKIAIKHYGYQPDVITAKNKVLMAKKTMESYLKKEPNDVYIGNKLGALYLQINEDKKGLKLLKTALKSNLANAEILVELYYHLANYFAKQKQFDNAIKNYQKAISQPVLEELKLSSYNNLATVYQHIKDWENAIKYYEIIIKINPTFALAYYNLGKTYKEMGIFLKAIDSYQKAIKFAPEYPWSYQNLAVLLFKKGKIEESIKLFKQAINLHHKQNPSEALRLKQELQAMGIIIN